MYQLSAQSYHPDMVPSPIITVTFEVMVEQPNDRNHMPVEAFPLLPDQECTGARGGTVPSNSCGGGSTFGVNDEDVNEDNQSFKATKEEQTIANRITMDKLRLVMHLPLKNAAQNLGICSTMLKRCCRMFGIARWPSRRIVAASKSICAPSDLLDLRPDLFSKCLGSEDLQQLRVCDDVAQGRGGPSASHQEGWPATFSTQPRMLGTPLLPQKHDIMMDFGYRRTKEDFHDGGDHEYAAGNLNMDANFQMPSSLSLKHPVHCVAPGCSGNDDDVQDTSLPRLVQRHKTAVAAATPAADGITPGVTVDAAPVLELEEPPPLVEAISMPERLQSPTMGNVL